MAFIPFYYPPWPRRVLVAHELGPWPAAPVDQNAFLASIHAVRWDEDRWDDIGAFLQQGPSPFQLVAHFDYLTPFGQRSLDVWQRGTNVVCVKGPMPEQMLVLCCFLEATQGSLKVFFRPLSGDPLPTTAEYDLVEDCELVTGADLYRSAREIAINNRVIEWFGQGIKLMLGNCMEVLPPSAVLWTRHAATRLTAPLRRCIGKVNGFQRRLEALVAYLQNLRSDELRYLYPSSAAELDFILDQVLGL